MTQAITATTVTPNNMAGIWGWKVSNELGYIQSNVAPQTFWTDDGIIRTAYPYSLESRRTLYDRPQSEWETPTLAAIAYAFSADGKFESMGVLESGHMPQGYMKQVLTELGTYTIQGDIITLHYTYRTASTYNDLQNYYKMEAEPGSVGYLRVNLGDAYREPTITQMVKLPDGTLVPDPNNPDGFPMERKALSYIIDLAKGMVYEGTLRADILAGSPNLDTIDSRDGNDVISSGNGNDQITGGNGSDRFVIDTPNNSYADRITDFNAAEDILAVKTPEFSGLTPNAFISSHQFEIGSQAMQAQTRFFYHPATGNLFFDADGNGAGAAIQIATVGANLNLNYTNFYAYQTLDSLSSIVKPNPGTPGTPPNPIGNFIQGTVSADNLVGTANADHITGLEGNDILSGGGGNDRLFGGSGADRLTGGSNNDWLWGGAGSDTLKGDAGADVFVLERGPGRDSIRDFRDTQDKLCLVNGMKFSDLQITESSGSTIISTGSDPLAILSNILPNQITAADFITL